MGQDAATPPGFWERVRKLIADEVGELLRSGFLRSASISEGGLTIKGGFLRLIDRITGVETFYVGPVQPPLPDGSYQPGMIVRRNDNSIALHLYDPIPAVGDYNQFLAWRDRQGSVVISDDTDSGQGLARPYLQSAFYPARSGDFLTTTVTVFETIWRAKMPKQHPRLYVEAWAQAVDVGAVAQIQVLVNNNVWGAPQSSVPGFVTGLNFGPLAVDGAFGDALTIEIQARRSVGTGIVRVGAAWVQGQQS